MGEMDTTYNSVVESQYFILWLNDHDDDLLLSPPGILVPVNNQVGRDDRSIPVALLP